MLTTDAMRAREFVHREGRVLERRILEAVFEGAPAGGVVDALRGYRNHDGGFGYGLEPDKGTPESQPLDVEIAFQSLDWVGALPADLVSAACDYLASVGAGVSCVTAGVGDHPHAPHWSDASTEPSLNPTASLAGFLWKWGIDHPWRDEATTFCWATLDETAPIDAHTAAGLLRFLEFVPDRDRATATVDEVRSGLRSMPWLRYDAKVEGYGVTPLRPNPAGPVGRPVPHPGFRRTPRRTRSKPERRRRLGRHLADDRTRAVSAWRGRLTLQNLLVLQAYSRL
jgi:hypothetical protein